MGVVGRVCMKQAAWNTNLKLDTSTHWAGITSLIKALHLSLAKAYSMEISDNSWALTRILNHSLQPIAIVRGNIHIEIPRSLWRFVDHMPTWVKLYILLGRSVYLETWWAGSHGVIWHGIKHRLRVFRDNILRLDVVIFDEIWCPNNGGHNRI